MICGEPKQPSHLTNVGTRCTVVPVEPEDEPKWKTRAPPAPEHIQMLEKQMSSNIWVLIQVCVLKKIWAEVT